MVFSPPNSKAVSRPKLNLRDRAQQPISREGLFGDLVGRTPAVVLAGGKGKRLLPLTREVTKPVVLFAGRAQTTYGELKRGGVGSKDADRPWAFDQ